MELGPLEASVRIALESTSQLHAPAQDAANKGHPNVPGLLNVWPFTQLQFC